MSAFSANVISFKCVNSTSGNAEPIVTPKVGGTGGGDGGMDDVLRRLGKVEADVSDIKTQVGAISAVLPHLASKSDLNSLETSILKWVIATAVAIIATVIAAAKLL